MTWLQNVDATTTKTILDNASLPKVPVTPLSPEVAQNLANNKIRAGWIPIEQLTALSKANASPQTVDAVGTLHAKNIVDLQNTEEPPSQSWKSKIYDVAKASARWSFAGLNFVPEFVQGGLAQIFDKNTDVNGWFVSTTLGSMIENPELQGQGFFAGKQLMDKQAERARRYRGEIAGSAWTYGRQSASLVFKPKSLPYNIMSGVVDALTLLATDPTGPAIKAIKGANALRYAVPLVAGEELSKVREVIMAGIGLSDGIAEHSLDQTKFFRFMRENPRGQALVKMVKDEWNPRVIAEDIFDHKLPNETVSRLAKATTDEEVIANLATGWGFEGGALPTDVREIIGSKFGNIIVDRLPLVDGIRKSRAFTEMPKKAIIINGSRFDNSETIKNMIGYLRTAGATADEVDNVVIPAIDAFSAVGTDPEKYHAITAFRETLKVAMVRSGAEGTVVDEMLKTGQKAITDLRAGLLDRAGIQTDNGMFSHITNENLDYLPLEEIQHLQKILNLAPGAKPIIVTPLNLVEMLNRVQILPDIRDVRRVTTNPFFAKALATITRNPSRFTSLAGKAELRTIQIVEKVNGEEYANLGNQISDIINSGTLRSTTQMSAAKKANPSTFKKLLEEQDVIKQTLKDLQDKRRALEITVTRKVVTGEQRAAVEALDFLQGRLWKTLTLATGGYVMRNSIDAQARMAFNGLPSLLTHPFEYIQLVLGKTKRIDVNGNLITGTKLEDLLGDHQRLWGYGMQEQGYGPKEIYDHMFKSGAWSTVNRTQGVAVHTNAVSQNATLIHNDILQKIAAQTFVELGSSDYQAQQVARSRIYNYIKKHPEIEKTLRNVYEGGLKVVDPTTGQSARSYPGIGDDAVEAWLLQHISRVPIANVLTQGGSLPELEFMQAFNRVPVMASTGGRVATIKMGVEDLQIIGKDKTVRVGAEVTLGDRGLGVVTKFLDESLTAPVIDPFTGELVDLAGKTAVISPVHGENAFTAQGAPSREARNLIDNMPLYSEKTKTGLPISTKLEIMVGEDKNSKQAFANTQDAMDKAAKWFFEKLSGTVSKKLERSPVFRELYYKNVIKNADLLSPSEAQKILDDVAKKAGEAKMSVRRYVGDQNFVDALTSSTKTAGTATAEHLDDYAKFTSLTEMRNMLFDASNKSNFEDAMRIVAPFASAWREVLGTYIGYFAENPVGMARSFQRVYTGAVNADPENSGRGFVYQDPQTKQMMFTFPASGPLLKAMTGLDASLVAPLKRLSQGAQAYPAIGPVAQMVVSKLLPDVPETDFIAKLLLPYGRKTVGATLNVAPGWSAKLVQALQGNSNDTSTQFFNTYVETMRALSASGDYNLADLKEVKQLQDDAKFKAQIITGFRALSQFVGPTAATDEYKIATQNGDIFMGELIKAFYDMQSDPKIGYDQAVPTFLATFGDEAALYVASKSKSLEQGQESSAAFGDWERSPIGKMLLKAYPRTGRFLAPSGSDFDFSVYDRQLSAGTRVKLSDNEIIALAQNRVGSSYYREAQKQAGPKPSEQQRFMLKQYRVFLHNKFPGFLLNAEFTVNRYLNDIEELKKLVVDPALASDKTAQTINAYLSARDQAIAASGVSANGFKTSSSAETYRQALISYGIVLSDHDPNFQRIFDRLFSSEVE